MLIFVFLLLQSGSSPSLVRLIQLIRDWTEIFPYDFRDEKMMRALKDVTQICSTFLPVCMGSPFSPFYTLSLIL